MSEIITSNKPSDSIIIIIIFYPRFINKIRSYHILTLEKYNKLMEIINKKTFFIERFFRTTKNSYDYICNDNIEIRLIEKVIEQNIIIDYLNTFDNNFDIYNMIISYYDDYDTISSISDDDMDDTVNIIKIFSLGLNNKKDKALEIIYNNPHLLEDETVTEYITDIDKT